MATSHLDFSAFIDDRTRDFTGREWVFAEIDRWLADPDGPSFFIITGELGIGKSAIAARLTQVRDLVAYHFRIACDAETIDPALFAQSLSGQLCRINGFARGILKDSNIDLKTTQNVQANYGQVIGAKIKNLGLNAPSDSAAFSPNGRWEISNGDNTARAWEASTGREFARITHHDIVSVMAFSPDGRWVVSGSRAKTVRVWRWQSQELIAEAGTRLDRNMTQTEWKQCLPDEQYRPTCPKLPPDK
jgi:hypothetical protein